MGTLTADCPRLDTHCPHKLATSCRLTSTPNCCACADERVHSRTYRVYIDGVGFVQRGTRWQGYCWFCKEFWNNRLAATDPPLEVAQTRIPEIPDQTEFLERWCEFHQGFRIVKREDGAEQRIAVIGEPFKDVSPGFLPRTLDQLRAGVENDAERMENRLRRRRLSAEDQPEQAHQSVQETLDDLLREADEAVEGLSQTTARRGASVSPRIQEVASEPPRPLTRREAQVQRARERFARVFGSREELQQDDYESPLTQMYSRAYDRYRQAEERRAEAPPLDHSPQLDWRNSVYYRPDAHQRVSDLLDSFSQRLSGSAEAEGDVWSYAPRRRSVEPSDLAQGEDPTVSDERWYDDDADDAERRRARRVEIAELQAANTRLRSVLATVRSARSGTATPSAGSSWRIEDRPRLLSGSPVGSSSRLQDGPPRMPTSLADSGLPVQDRPRLLPTQIVDDEMLRSLGFMGFDSHRPPSPPLASLDNQPGRPGPKTDEEMTKVLACQVCYQQIADVAVLPCGHMVMCQWCADVVVPVKHGHIPQRPTKCPMCRKQVKQRFKIHTG